MATFADMAILLMAFFALLYSFTEINVKKQAYFAAKIRAAFGVERVVIMDDIASAASMLDENFTPVVAEASLLAEPTNQSLTPARRYRTKYTETEAGLVDVQRAQINLTRSLSEEIIRGEAKVEIEDDVVVIQFYSLFTAGGIGKDIDETRGERVEQSVIDIAAKVLTANPDNNLQVDFRIKGLQTPNAEDVKNRLELESDIVRINDVLFEEISNGRLELILTDDQLIARLNSQDSFDSGQAELKPETKIFLVKLGKILNSSSGRIRIEGHTDNMPLMFSERFVSNWDLSTARASSVAAALITGSGVSKARLVVAGFSDSRPLTSNVTKEGRAKNRRIEIIVSAAMSRGLKPNG
jgi:chemotaxis protein MotB